MDNTISYLKNLIADRNVASITPTSSFGVQRILRNIDFSKKQVIVEYGPGGGVFTRAILERMTPDSILIAIENNEMFANNLGAETRDSRLHIYNESAENVLAILNALEIPSVDYIISGIPFSMFPVELKDRILKATNDALNSEGSFFVYQFLFSFCGAKKDIRVKLDEHLRVASAQFEMLCVPPLRIYEAKKKLE